MPAIGKQPPSLVGSPEVEVNLVTGVVVGERVSWTLDTLVQRAFPRLGVSNGQGISEKFWLSLVRFCFLPDLRGREKGIVRAPYAFGRVYCWLNEVNVSEDI